MKFFLPLLLWVTLAIPQDLDRDIRARFSIDSARPILETGTLGPREKGVAQRIRGYIKSGSNWTFVAEDGKACAVWVGAVDKLGIDLLGLLTEDDKYRLLIAEKEMIPYNVSQRMNLKYSTKKTRSVPLKPLVLLDRYRTLCGPGVASAMDPLPRNSLFLAIIDDRQRGPTPNMARRIEMREQVGSPIVVGVSGDWYRLQFTTSTRQEDLRIKHLEVHGRTLQTRSAGPPKRDHYAARGEVERRYPDHGFVPTSEARWNGRTYFMAYFRKKGSPTVDTAPFVWDGKE